MVALLADPSTARVYRRGSAHQLVDLGKALVNKNAKRQEIDNGYYEVSYTDGGSDFVESLSYTDGGSDFVESLSSYEWGSDVV